MINGLIRCIITTFFGLCLMGIGHDAMSTPILWKMWGNCLFFYFMLAVYTSLMESGKWTTK